MGTTRNLRVAQTLQAKAATDLAQIQAQQAQQNLALQQQAPDVFQTSPQQQEALDILAGRAGDLSTTLPGQIDQAIQFGMQDILDVQNPFTQAAIQAAISPISENFLQNIFPQIGSVAQQQGAFGGARQGLLEAQAALDLNRAVGEVTSQFSFDAFNRALDTFEKTLALTPGLVDTSFAPGRVALDVAGFPQTQFERLAGVSAGLTGGFGIPSIPGGGAGTKQPSTAAKALGGAAAGAAVGSAIPGIGTAIGAGVGAVIGILG